MMVVVVVPTPTTTDITPRGHDEPILDSTVRFLRSTPLRLLVLNRNGQWRIQLGHSLPDFHPLILGGSFLLFLIPSDRRIHHSRRNRTGSFPDLRTCCCWFRDRTNNSLLFFLFFTCLLSIRFNRSTTKKTHLNVPTQPNWRWPWLLGDDFRPLQIHPTDTGQFRRTRKDLHHTLPPTSSAHTFAGLRRRSSPSLSIQFRLFPNRVGSSLTHPCFLGALFFFCFFLLLLRVAAICVVGYHRKNAHTKMFHQCPFLSHSSLKKLSRDHYPFD